MASTRFALIALCLVAAPAMAQDATTDGDTSSSTGGTASVDTMANLIKQGYEIKTASPAGDGKLIIFLQNDTAAYACEFTNLVKTRCGAIN